MATNVEDVDPTTDWRELAEEWSKAIVETLGPEGYLVLYLVAFALGGASLVVFDHPFNLVGYGAGWVAAMLVSIGFFRVHGTFERGLREALLCDRLHLHRGAIETYDGITVLECDRCGRPCHPIVNETVPDLDDDLRSDD